MTELLLTCFFPRQNTKLEKLISKNYFLNQSAKEAFKAYVRAYDSHQLKAIFEVATLDLKKVALSFGFTVPPVVDLSTISAIIFNSFAFIKIILISSIFPLELGHKIRGRPEKRVGGGGYGHFKTMNNDDQNKARKFKNISGTDLKRKQFTR